MWAPPFPSYDHLSADTQKLQKSTFFFLTIWNVSQLPVQDCQNVELNQFAHLIFRTCVILHSRVRGASLCLCLIPDVEPYHTFRNFKILKSIVSEKVIFARRQDRPTILF